MSFFKFQSSIVEVKKWLYNKSWKIYSKSLSGTTNFCKSINFGPFWDDFGHPASRKHCTCRAYNKSPADTILYKLVNGHDYGGYMEAGLTMFIIDCWFRIASALLVPSGLFHSNCYSKQNGERNLNSCHIENVLIQSVHLKWSLKLHFSDHVFTMLESTLFYWPVLLWSLRFLKQNANIEQ